jgi:seryl-tRNA(Sec) selenium transferase
VLTIASATRSADELAAALRHNEIPIVARVEDERLVLDLRTIEAEQDEIVAKALLRLA